MNKNSESYEEYLFKKKEYQNNIHTLKILTTELTRLQKQIRELKKNINKNFKDSLKTKDTKIRLINNLNEYEVRLKALKDDNFFSRLLNKKQKSEFQEQIKRLKERINQQEDFLRQLINYEEEMTDNLNHFEMSLKNLVGEIKILETKTKNKPVYTK